MPQTAQALYAGILTDTGQFRFNSTSRRCFLLAGELVARGAAPAEAGYELYERESVGKLQLLQRFLSSLRIECGGRVCIGRLPEALFAATGTGGEDTEGLVDYARSIEGVEIGVLIEERPGGALKASLRAKDPACRVDLIAAQFHGGGHACAAGLNLNAGAGRFSRPPAGRARAGAWPKWMPRRKPPSEPDPDHARAGPRNSKASFSSTSRPITPPTTWWPACAASCG